MSLSFDIAGNSADFIQQAEQMQYAIIVISQEAEKQAGKVEASFDRMASSAETAGVSFGKWKNIFDKLGGTEALKKFVGEVVNVRAEFQQLELSFATLLQSKEEANTLMSQIMETAATTPFSVAELGAGAKQLLAYGTQADEVNQTLVQLGTLAAGVGAPLERVVSLYGTILTQGSLSVSNLEQFASSGIPMLQGLADIYGVTAEEVNRMVSAGKVGFPEVQKAIADMTGEGGQFYNVMQQQSQTIAGKLADLSDAWAQMLNNIGESQEGLIGTSLNAAQGLIENYETIGKVLLNVIEIYGIYKAACVAHIVLTQTLATTQLELGMVMAKLRNSFVALTATMNLNPFVLLATAVVGLGVVLWNFTDHADAATKAQKRLNEEQDKARQKEEQRRQKIGNLIKILQDETETEQAKIKAYEELGQASPALVNSYKREELATLDLAESQKVLNEERDKQKYTDIVNGIAKTEKKIQELKKTMDGLTAQELETGADKYYQRRIEDLEEYILKLKGAKEEIDRLRKQAEEDAKPIEEKIKIAEVDLKQMKEEFNKLNERLQAEIEKRKNRLYYIIPLDIQLETAIAKDKKEKQQKKVDALKLEQSHGSTYQQDLAIAKQQWTEAKRAYQALLNDKNATSLAVKEAERNMLAKEKDYKNLGGDTDNKYAEQAENLRQQHARLQKLLLSQQKETARSTDDLWNEIWQIQIDSMAEGSEKALSQMELNHEKELQAIDREKADWLQKKKDQAEARFNAAEDEKKTANPAYIKKTFDPSNITLSQEETAMFDQKYKASLDRQAAETQAYYDAQAQSMNDYLAAYGDYAQKRQAILDRAEARKKGKNEWEQKTIDEETEKALSDLDVEVNKKTAAFGRLFSDMKEKNVSAMRDIAATAQSALAFVQSGNWDEARGKEFGISRETFAQLQKSPDEIARIEEGIRKMKKEADDCDTAFNKLAKGLHDLFASQGDSEKTKNALSDIERGLNEVVKTGRAYSSVLSDMGNALGSSGMGNVAEGIGTAMDTATSALAGAQAGAQAGAVFGPWGSAAGAAIGLVSSLGSSLAKLHDAKHEKSIQRIQDQIEVLEKTYDNLGRSVEKAYSSDASQMIAQQNTLLEQQKVLIGNQIKEEKDKKKTDWGRVKEWENQIEEINRVIGENKEKQIDAILGEDVKTAIDNFAQAYAAAWEAGEDRAQSSKEVVKNMIKQLITEAMKSAASKPMEALRRKMAELFADGIISSIDRRELEKQAEDIVNQLDRQFGWADQYMKGEEDPLGGADAEESSKGAFQSMSQETGEELNGRFTALQTSGEEIRNSLLLALGSLSTLCTTAADGNLLLSEMRNLAVISNSYLEDIARYTKPLLGVGEKLDKIERNTANL